ncbi:type II toxin-antitoxin system RelE/ParE family toxin [Leptolyngbya sp. NIES-2104]|uniref:type II toxin-antitoxin system RelE/ParE family toxin n=1 Tax=Leptolyngbya sp. NIES-2104 TaxID=1552121 RepID=UPI0006EC5A48|nr:type II toxin-antitoxin system mRNA interferase toxin, RelE/StbE family [Leptolyngbya sp. NIES-2104]GAP98357.1 HigB toxin protein [Leptolyngbya sp. NIES-2104]
MRTLLFDESFRRALKKRGKNRPDLRSKVTEVLSLLETDPFTPSLKTHKLQGELKGLWACSVEYDCRIVFKFEQLDEETEEAIVLIDIGSHDEVY